MKKMCISLLVSAVFFCQNSYNKLHVIQNKYADSLLTILRNKTTDCELFEKTTKQLANYLAFEAAQFLDFEPNPIETPCGPHVGKKLKKNPILVTVYRAGLSLVAPFRNYFEGATCGFFGIKRNEETAKAYLYYRNLPKIAADDKIIVLEPMLATGGTLQLVIDDLKHSGAANTNIIIVAVVSATNGVQNLETKYPGISIITAALDTELNEKKYIVPGLGDFGDRFFGNAYEQDFEQMG